MHIVRHMFKHSVFEAQLKNTSGINVDDVRELFFYLYENFPGVRLPKGTLEKVFVSEEVLNGLISQAYITKEPHKDSFGKTYFLYALGPNALPLISAWKMEKLTDKIFVLTVAMTIVALASIFLSILQILSNPFYIKLAKDLSLIIFQQGIFV
mgnify:CR=1 FL=1